MQQKRRIFYTHILSVMVTPNRKVSSAFGERILNMNNHEVSFAIYQFNSSTEPRYSQTTSLDVQVFSVPLLMYHNSLLYYPPSYLHLTHL